MTSPVNPLAGIQLGPCFGRGPFFESYLLTPTHYSQTNFIARLLVILTIFLRLLFLGVREVDWEPSFSKK